MIWGKYTKREERSSRGTLGSTQFPVVFPPLFGWWAVADDDESPSWKVTRDTQKPFNLAFESLQFNIPTSLVSNMKIGKGIFFIYLPTCIKWYLYLYKCKNIYLSSIFIHWYVYLQIGRYYIDMQEWCSTKFFSNNMRIIQIIGFLCFCGAYEILKRIWYFHFLLFAVFFYAFT